LLIISGTPRDKLAARYRCTTSTAEGSAKLKKLDSHDEMRETSLTIAEHSGDHARICSEKCDRYRKISKLPYRSILNGMHINMKKGEAGKRQAATREGPSDKGGVKS